MLIWIIRVQLYYCHTVKLYFSTTKFKMSFIVNITISYFKVVHIRDDYFATQISMLQLRGRPLFEIPCACNSVAIHTRVDWNEIDLKLVSKSSTCDLRRISYYKICLLNFGFSYVDTCILTCKWTPPLVLLYLEMLKWNLLVIFFQ